MTTALTTTRLREPEDFCHNSGSITPGVLEELLSEYAVLREAIGALAVHVQEYPDAMDYFLRGAKDTIYGSSGAVAAIFNTEKAIAVLNSEFWSRALDQTDVLDCMPQERRNEWQKQIEAKTCPDFVEATVRDTLTHLLRARGKFLSEMVSGLFRALSGGHLTNHPEGFSKRMILADVFDKFGFSNPYMTGYVHDLRCILAKFTGRGTPSRQLTYDLLQSCRSRSGEWRSVDGGALRVRGYKIGTVHLEVHPEMAWRLNWLLAAENPNAIPAKYRERPAKKAKDVTLFDRAIPFPVLNLLGNGKSRGQVFEFAYGVGEDRNVLAEAVVILEALGGTATISAHSKSVQFEYPIADVIQEVLVSGCLPDTIAYQYYPTPEFLVDEVMRLADVAPGMRCLEPSAGTGNIARAFPEPARVTCVEIHKLHASILERMGFGHVIRADFLNWWPLDGLLFDRIVMNPPFSSGRAESHVLAAAKLVAPGGRLVAILPDGCRSLTLPGFRVAWHARHEAAFPGVSVAVNILVAERAA